MSGRHVWPALTPALLGLLLACNDDTGTPCRQDHHCYSNSCTFGTCDSRWSTELAESLFGDDDAPEERPQTAARCWELSQDECRTRTQCKVVDPCRGLPTCEDYERVGVPCPASTQTCTSRCTSR
jgi:hypothetical protein